MVRRSQAEAAITGTFFSTTSLYPIGDIVVDGRMRYAGGMGSAIALTPDNRVTFRRLPFGRLQDWTGYETVLAAGPTLIRNGRIDLFPAREHFNDPGLLGRALRTAIGLRKEHKLLFIAVHAPVTLHELAKIALRAGCVHALNLDGGSSAALFYRGSVILHPQRRLVNILVARSGVPPEFRYVAGGASLWGSLHIKKRLTIASWKQKVGEALAKQGRWEEAVEAFRIAARLAPDNASYHLSYAHALNALGYQAARATALAEAGDAFARKGMLKEAAAQLRRALHLNPNDLPTRRRYARVLLSLGRSSDAELQQSIAEFRQLIMATPLGGETATRLLSESLIRPPSPYYREIAPAPHKAAASTGELSVSTRPPTRTKWDFRLQLRGEWEFSQNKAKTVIYLKERGRHFSGVVRVFPVRPDLTLSSFRQRYHARQFHCCELSIPFNREGAVGIEDHCRSIVAGVEVIARCLYVRRENYILAMTLSADASRQKAANLEFDRIVRSLKFSR